MISISVTANHLSLPLVRYLLLQEHCNCHMQLISMLSQLHAQWIRKRFWANHPNPDQTSLETLKLYERYLPKLMILHVHLIACFATSLQRIDRVSKKKTNVIISQPCRIWENRAPNLKPFESFQRNRFQEEVLCIKPSAIPTTPLIKTSTLAKRLWYQRSLASSHLLARKRLRY